MKVNTQEVLRYLGYRGQAADEDIYQTIRDCTDELMQEAAPRRVHQTVDIKRLDDGRMLVGFTRIDSRDLSAHLAGCDQAILFAATLGARVDMCLQRCYLLSMGRAVIMQACAASLIESWCDESEQPLAEAAARRGLYLRPRYSPGYGDFSIEHQIHLLTALDCPRKINLTMTNSYMLTPTKSVTAVIGLTREKQSCHINRCMECTAKSCPFRKAETP